MNRMLTSLIMAGVTLGGPVAVYAQPGALSIEARGGYSVPIGDFGDNVGSDFGFGVGATLGLTPGIGLYAGWGRDSFDCEHFLCREESRLRSSGFEAGAMLMDSDGEGVRPWIRAGLTSHTVVFDGEVVSFASDRRLGFQGIVGLDVPLTPGLSLAPGLRLHLMNVDDDDFFDDPDVRYISVDIVGRFRIPRN